MDNLYFFGRFNFPHYGYLYVIREGINRLSPTNGMTIVFSREKATWGKQAISLEHRLAMFSLACAELPENIRNQIHFSTIEYELAKKLGKAYGGFTIDTVHELLTNHPEDSGLIMGADAMLGIPDVHAGFTAWKDWDEIQKLMTLVTLPRGRYKTAEDISRHLSPPLHPIVLHTAPNEIELHASSTAIQNGNLEYLPKSVYEYAVSHSLLIQY